jgi:hypothetical protein
MKKLLMAWLFTPNQATAKALVNYAHRHPAALALVNRDSLLLLRDAQTYLMEG